jgi:hypothetical protein
MTLCIYHIPLALKLIESQRTARGRPRWTHTGAGGSMKHSIPTPRIFTAMLAGLTIRNSDTHKSTRAL